jgi:hypothetical protein
MYYIADYGVAVCVYLITQHTCVEYIQEDSIQHQKYNITLLFSQYYFDLKLKEKNISVEDKRKREGVTLAPSHILLGDCVPVTACTTTAHALDNASLWSSVFTASDASNSLTESDDGPPKSS